MDNNGQAHTTDLSLVFFFFFNKGSDKLLDHRMLQCQRITLLKVEVRWLMNDFISNKRSMKGYGEDIFYTVFPSYICKRNSIDGNMI